MAKKKHPAIKQLGTGKVLIEAGKFGETLQGANLQGADLRGADLQGADLDFSCWPLCCGSFDVKVDIGIIKQLAYHFCRLNNSSKSYKEARAALLKLANGFHRIGDDVDRIDE